LIGATFGLVGTFVAFTPLLRGVSGMVAGTFLIIFGLDFGSDFPLRSWLSSLKDKLARDVWRFKAAFWKV
jgi:sulfite exporter TauE/SafE